MADEPQTPPEGEQNPTPEVQPQEPQRREPPDDNLIGEAKRKQREAEKEAKDLRDRLQALEDKDKSELERERTQRERLQADLADREQRLQRAERGSWVRDAATEAKFIDPADALGRVNLSEVESEADAKRAVKRIADSAKHLIQQEPERPQIGQVLKDGRQATAGQEEPLTDDQRVLLEQIQSAQNEGWTSTPFE